MKVLFLFSFLLLIFSCKQKENSATFIFYPDYSQIRDSNFVFNRIVFHFKDSIYFEKFFVENNSLICNFFEYNGNIYQHLERKFMDKNYGIDSIITFSQKDTCFIYKALFPEHLLIHYYALEDRKYIIENKKDYIITTIQNLTDTTYKEIFYYNKDFRIFKYVNTYQDNVAVYLPEK